MIKSINQTDPANKIESSNCAILIVDDSETDRVTYRRYLETSKTFSCNIWDCESAEEALDICQQNCPSIILLDYLLPGTNGLEFLQELVERVETIPPVIMLTGQGNENVAVEAMKHGVRDYLIKGQLTPLKLVTAISNVLTEQKLQAQIARQFQQQQLLASIRLKIGESIELAQVLQSAVDGCRQLLDCDRASIYKLSPNLSGRIVAESVLPQWSSSLGQQIEEDCFDGAAHPIAKYLDGQKFIVADVDAAELSACYVAMLKGFEVRALVVAPILFREVAAHSSTPRVWGLLIVHQCRSVRTWVADEIELVHQLSIQIAVALQQAELIANLQTTLTQQQTIEQQLRDRVIEIEQTNIRLSVATRLLEKRNQELDEFACIASHDLQAPLRGIANLTDWLSNDLAGNLPPENQEQIDLIQARVLQMDTLIKGLLQYSRVGRENVEPTEIALGQTIAEAIEIVAPGPNFQVHFPADLPALKTQTLLLRQVFASLIGNAVRFHDRELGKIEIFAIDREYLWEFTVVDDGPGIAFEHHKKIFGIFQTISGHNEKKGTGVGLAIVQKIVESRGGSVWVASTGRGSAFSFTWVKTP
jgi:signal transduction histidine kinase/DNA-binding NarL/FixJ family response regulator